MSVITNDGTANNIIKILPVETTTATTPTSGTVISTKTFPMENNVATIHNYDGATTSDAVISHNGREARNLAEKQRRDKLNASIHELSTMVPHVAESTRRLDKTAVLRFAAHGFRLQHVFGKSANQRKRQKHEQPQIANMLLELLDSFLITLTCHGQIVLISETVENLLGHCRLDLYGQNILNIIHPEDQAFLQQQLIPNDLEIMFNRKYPHTTTTTTTTAAAAGTTKIPRTTTNEYQQEYEDADDDVEMSSEIDDANDVDHDEDINSMSDEEEDEENENISTDTWAFKRGKAQRQRLKYLDKRLFKDRRSFTVRVARASTRSETTRNYEIVKFDGCFRRSDNSASDQGNTFPIVAQLIRRQRSTANIGNSVNFMQHDAIAQAALHGVSGNDIVFVGMARIIHPPKLNMYPLNSLIPQNNLEYRTRHLIDGRIVDCDQRISLVAGYMKDEVTNLSPFSFMHQDDVRWVIVALRQMYDCNSNYGESCYRLLTRNGNFIYLQTRGFLEIDKSTNKVHSFVCINTLLDEEEGKRRVQEMKNKFSVIIQTKIPSNSPEDVPASQNPQQLERIVLYLIENLQKQDSTSTTSNNSTNTKKPTTTITATATTTNDLNHVPATVGSHHTMVLSAQPLALVPPEPSSVRNSISRSVSVVQQQYSAKSPSCSSQFCGSEVSLSPASSSNENNDDILLSSSECSTKRASVLHMKQQRQHTQSPEQQQLQPQHQQNSDFHNHHNKINNNHHITRSPTSSTSPLMHCMTPESSISPDIIQQSVDSNNSQYPCKDIILLKRLQTPKKKCPGKSNVLRHKNELYAHNSPTISPKSLLSTSASTTTTACSISSSTSSVIPTEIHNVLTSSWRRLDRSLDTIGEDAHTLRQQQASHSIDRQLDSLLVEHDMQQEMLVHIKSEYDAHLHLQDQEHQQQQQQQQQQQVYFINGAGSLPKNPLSLLEVQKPL